jgi:hypothetical protein
MQEKSDLESSSPTQRSKQSNLTRQFYEPTLTLAFREKSAGYHKLEGPPLKIPYRSRQHCTASPPEWSQLFGSRAERAFRCKNPSSPVPTGPHGVGFNERGPRYECGTTRIAVLSHPTKDVLTRPLSGNDKASFLRRLRIDRMCPLQIHLDSLKIDLEKLHQVGEIAATQFQGGTSTAKVDHACRRFSGARKAHHTNEP